MSATNEVRHRRGMPSKYEGGMEQAGQEQESAGAPAQSLSATPYLSAFLFPLLLVMGVCMGGFWTYGCVFLAFVVMPAAELFWVEDSYNPSKEECDELEDSLRFKLVTWLYAPVPAMAVMMCAYALSTEPYSVVEVVGIVLSSGVVSGGIGITVSHELMHKNSKFEQFLSKFMLAFTCYMHFYIEHLQGHHKRVATHEDPASSRLGESLYAFVPRSVIGSFMSAWELEMNRLARKDISWLSWRNQMLWFIGLPLMIAAALGLCFGPMAIAYFAVQSVVGFTLLEVVNYIEHYGLARQKQQRGYERVTPLHSWNADHAFSNYVLFKLQRHADHHAWPKRRYQTLRTWDFSPKMPTGYSGMMLLALFPPLWRRVVDPMVERYNGLYAQRISATDSYLIRPREEVGTFAKSAPQEEKPAEEVISLSLRPELLFSALLSTYSLPSREYVDAFVACIPVAVREQYLNFSPSFSMSLYFPDVTLDWLYARLPEPSAQKLRGRVRYVRVRAAQVLFWVGSAIAWLGAQLGGRGATMLLVRFGMHMCHWSESILFHAKPAMVGEKASNGLQRSHSSPCIGCF